MVSVLSFNRLVLVVLLVLAVFGIVLALWLPAQWPLVLLVLAVGVLAGAAGVWSFGSAWTGGLLWLFVLFPGLLAWRALAFLAAVPVEWPSVAEIVVAASVYWIVAVPIGAAWESRYGN